MNKGVVIIGAGSQGKVIADIILKSGDKIIGFLDDDLPFAETYIGFSILGNIKSYKQYKEYKFIIAIGNIIVRKKLAEKLHDVMWYTAIHPSAVISGIDVVIAGGTVVMANAVINAGTTIGKHCIINSAAVVEHDNCIEDFVHISVGVKLAGTVYIGNGTWVGIGAVISNNLDICGNCMIGAGATVIKGIEEPGTYVGTPAKKI